MKWKSLLIDRAVARKISKKKWRVGAERRKAKNRSIVLISQRAKLLRPPALSVLKHIITPSRSNQDVLYVHLQLLCQTVPKKRLMTRILTRIKVALRARLSYTQSSFTLETSYARRINKWKRSSLGVNLSRHTAHNCFHLSKREHHCSAHHLQSHIHGSVRRRSLRKYCQSQLWPLDGRLSLCMSCMLFYRVIWWNRRLVYTILCLHLCFTHKSIITQPFTKESD